jgi:hypothetical protein
MDGDIDAALEQGVLDCLGERAVAAKLHKRDIAHLVANGFDFDQFDWPIRVEGAQQIRDVMSLPERERTAARADA